MADGGIIHISGLSGALAAPVAGSYIEEGAGPVVIVTPTFDTAAPLAKNLAFFTDREILVLPEDDPFYFSFEAKSHGALNDRIGALIAFGRHKPCVVIAPASAALKKMIPPEEYYGARLFMKVGDFFDRMELRGRLARLGFERVPFVESRGEFGFRGDILDIFPADSPWPLRIEFFDNEIESMRFFDAVTQKSIEKIHSSAIYPVEEMLISAEMAARANLRIRRAYDRDIKSRGGAAGEALMERKEALLEYIATGSNRQLLENFLPYFIEKQAFLTDYLPPEGRIIADDPSRIREVVSRRYEEAAEDFSVLLEGGQAASMDFEGCPDTNDLAGIFAGDELKIFSPLEMGAGELASIIGRPGADIEERCCAAREPVNFRGNMELFRSGIRRYQEEGFKAVIVCAGPERMDNLREFLISEGLSGAAELVIGEMSGGIELTSEKSVWLWDGEIFKSARAGRRGRFGTEKGLTQPLRRFSDLSPGDYVVHEHHGIGRYAGIERLTVQGASRDYLKVKYAGNDVLYVPVEQMALIQKYIGGGESAPVVSKLDGGEWKKAKAKVKADIANLAGELIRMSAERLSYGGYAFSPDTVWQKEFEDRFPWEETEDQLKCIASIKADMERPAPMDRLLCGDVGYGKTEVALRAVFKCVADGKQAVVLTPTTILASQHYLTFSHRFEDFPFNVEMLSRFRTAKEQEKIISKLKNGGIDVVIGTHRALSKDVVFKDLGLLVIDEEHRFGVKHKEIIKDLKKSVDVLTLTATPIPRTLHMSLMGIRDMDIISEPPEERYPIQTYVMKESDDIIRETIQREMGRKGQIYAVVPRINGIGRRADNIQSLVPEARIAVAHGRMREHDLEDIMMDFIQGRYDILVSTTIIESGIDIPNVNTILVFEADRFGLSQLYQLRGRVGRSNRVAFSYLLYKKQALTETANKRLRAIREFTEFGVGFKIAMRDMELRGAGNILGPEQHGHMASVGYELYCRMVEEAVAALKGKPLPPSPSDVKIDLCITAYLPDDYIDDEGLRLEQYRRIALIGGRGEGEEVLNDLADRFGPVPWQARNLITVAEIRRLAEDAEIVKIYKERGEVLFRRKQGSASKGHVADTQAIMELLGTIRGDL